MSRHLLFAQRISDGARVPQRRRREHFKSVFAQIIGIIVILSTQPCAIQFALCYTITHISRPGSAGPLIWATHQRQDTLTDSRSHAGDHDGSNARTESVRSYRRELLLEASC